MSADTMPVWVVWQNTDRTEGRGGIVPIAVCAKEATARRLAKGQYVQGCDCDVRQTEARYIDGLWFGPVRIIGPTKEDDSDQTRMDKRAAAIAKAVVAGLSAEEIKAIGGES